MDRKILISGNLTEDIQPLYDRLNELTIGGVELNPLVPGQVDPLALNGSNYAICVHCLGEAAEEELRAFAEHSAQERPALLVVAPPGGNSPQIMRLAMQAGARDFLIYPPTPQEVESRIQQILEDLSPTKGEPCTRTAFVSPKSGGGASMVAEHVAHALASHFKVPTLLIDLDTQFGTHFLNLDLRPNKGLKEALEEVDMLDAVALKGYVGQHQSGLDVLGVLPEQILLPGEIRESSLNKLMDLLADTYQQIVVDLPCHIDPTFSQVVEKMRHVVMVLQQDFQNLRNTQKLNHILREELRIPSARLAALVNRYESGKAITLKDVERGLQISIAGTIPSDSQSVTNAANLGLPLLQYRPKSTVSLAILDIAGWIVGHQPSSTLSDKGGLFGQLRRALNVKT